MFQPTPLPCGRAHNHVFRCPAGLDRIRFRRVGPTSAPLSMPAWTPKNILLLVLALVSVGYLFVFVRGLVRAREQGRPANPSPGALGTGFFTNFWDTLGIGSFATTTAIFRAFKMVPDEQIPGTLNVGHTLPPSPRPSFSPSWSRSRRETLIADDRRGGVGSWLGAGVVSGGPAAHAQIGMGIALLVAAGHHVTLSVSRAAAPTWR